ncbi:hypothetical protein H4J59_18170 [Colwellia sp. MB02u-10]|uniref:hypothetical protein n=1 Tax=Colwellia sp. MB02u-10 TaxID=2759828 RepID=UPI0015F4B10B|nr:hypothetical protein [Colwellia sp. MB02u-10]MBA6342918.1 hypothetical protein [Colwellia sp. MB02u-10]
MNKTIALIGSSRRDDNTGKLIDLIARQLGIEVIDLALKNISPADTFEYLAIHYGGFVHLDYKNSFDLLLAEKAVKNIVNKLNQTV